LAQFETDRQRLEIQVATPRRRAVSGPAMVEAVADQLLETLRSVPGILESADAEERKAVVRAFLARIRIEKTTRQAVLSWFRLPRLDGVSLKLVELRGLEPLTPRLPGRDPRSKTQ
jgi:hypothetical protein